MPRRYRKSAKKPVRKTVRRRRMMPRRKQRLMNSIVVGNSVKNSFPQRVRMRYVELITINSEGIANAHYQFRANSIFDPNYTGSGHQPYKHDTYQQLFDHYLVYKSFIKCEVAPAQQVSDEVGNIFGLGLYVRDVATTEDSFSLLSEKGTGRTMLANSDPSKKYYLKSMYSAKSFFNIKNIKDNSDRLGAQFGTNPAEDVIYTITQYAMGVDPVPINIKVVIDYYCLLSEPRDLTQS